jgi:hypothetical protein
MPEEALELSLLAVTRHLYRLGAGDCFRFAPAPSPLPLPASHTSSSSTTTTTLTTTLTRRVMFTQHMVDKDHAKQKDKETCKTNGGGSYKGKSRDSGKDRGRGRGRGQAREQQQEEEEEEVFTDEGCFDKATGLSEQAWEQVLSASYRVAMSMPAEQRRLVVPTAAVLANTRSSPRQLRAALLLRALERQDCQFLLNGERNIWVVKVSACLPVILPSLHLRTGCVVMLMT